MVFSIIFFLFYRRYLFNIYKEIDYYHDSQDDFTIFVEDIPELIDAQTQQKGQVEFNYELAIRRMFEPKIKEWIERLKET